MKLVGTFDNHEVYYDKASDIVHCKDISVYLRQLLLFRDSERVRTSLNSTLSIIKTDTTYKIGCLEDSHAKFNSLIKKAQQTNN